MRPLSSFHFRLFSSALGNRCDRRLVQLCTLWAWNESVQANRGGMLRMGKMFPTSCGPGPASRINPYSLAGEWTILLMILLVPLAAVSGSAEEKNKNCKYSESLCHF